MSTAAPSVTNFGEELELTSLGIPADEKALALRVLEETPLPTTRTEAWKYTRVAKLGKIAFRNEAASVSDVSPYLPDPNAPVFVFVNGHFAPELSSTGLTNGIRCQVLDAKATLSSSILPLEGEIFNALNTAYLTGGCLLEIDANADIEQAVQIIPILKGNHVLSNFRTIVHAGKHSRAKVIQGFFSEGEGTNFCNNVTEINVGENASFTLEKVQYESGENFHISTEEIAQEGNSTCTVNTVTLNGGLVRNNVHVAVNGQNCTSNLNGAYLLKDKQHVDNHTVIDHKVANCGSNELYKGVVDDKSTAVFNGKVYVRPDAQKINAFQSNGNVLLSDDATVNSKPELEIYADDVKCSHGSTTGQLDEEAVFYLRARGVSEKAARQLLVSAFIGEVLDAIEHEPLLDFTHRLLQERFGWSL